MPNTDIPNTADHPELMGQIIIFQLDFFFFNNNPEYARVQFTTIALKSVNQNVKICHLIVKKNLKRIAEIVLSRRRSCYCFSSVGQTHL